METFMLTGLTIAGKSIVVNLIGDVYGLARETSYHPEVKSTLDSLDLEADLQVIEALLHQVEDPKGCKQLDGKRIADNPVYICLDQVHQMIHKIKEELETIQKTVEEHDEKWFSSWRTPYYRPYLKAIHRHKTILDKRVDMLIKILQLTRSKTIKY